MRSSKGTALRSRRSGRIEGRAVVIETVTVSQIQSDLGGGSRTMVGRPAVEKTPYADIECHEFDVVVGWWGLRFPRHPAQRNRANSRHHATVSRCLLAFRTPNPSLNNYFTPSTSRGFKQRLQNDLYSICSTFGRLLTPDQAPFPTAFLTPPLWLQYQVCNPGVGEYSWALANRLFSHCQAPGEEVRC
jgi:hypothetical protein